MATKPMPALAASSISGVSFCSIAKLYAVRTTSITPLFMASLITAAWWLWVLTPAKRILPDFLADCRAPSTPADSSPAPLTP